MADEQFEVAAGRNVLTALPRELLVLLLGALDAASIACLALCSKALRNAIREKIPAAQRTLRVSDFVRDPKLLAVGLTTFEFPCVSLTACAIRMGSIPTLDYLRQIGLLDAKIVCRAAAVKGDLAVLEWSLLPDVNRYWTPALCEEAAMAGTLSGLGANEELRAWIVKNGCPCLGRDFANTGTFRGSNYVHVIASTSRAVGAQLVANGLGPTLPRQRIPLPRSIPGCQAVRPKPGDRPRKLMLPDGD